MQIAYGGYLEPQMFSLTTKIKKMRKSSIDNETPAIRNVLLADSGGLEQFLDEQKHAQEQADKNEQLLDELVEEWKKYPNGKPKVQFEGYGSHLR